MISIDCPHCGPRVSGEFAFLGDGPAGPAAEPVDIVQWRHYLYLDDNRPDWTAERWIHAAGCNRVVELSRHRLTNDIRPRDPDPAR